MTVSNYIITREPNRFGDYKQTEYLKESKKIIAEGTEKLKTAISNGSNLTTTFITLLDFLGQKRHDFAKANGTKDAHLFGLMRNSEKAVSGMDTHAYTYLDGKSYAEYGDKMVSVLQKRLAKMIHDANQFYQKNQETREPDCFGRQSTFGIEIFSREEIKKLRWDQPPDYSKSKKANEIIGQDLSLFEKLKLLKKEEPTLYKQDRMHLYINILNSSCPERNKTDLVLATARLQINGKLFAISQYLTWLNCNGKEDPVAVMKNESKILTLHQDIMLLDQTLDDIADIFQKAINWKPSSSIKELKGHVGFLRYSYAHAMPLHRGSASVAEYLENIIYDGIHGFDLKYAEGKSIDLEALTLPLDEFMNVYDKTVIVTAPSKKTET